MNPASVKATTVEGATTSSANSRNLSGTTGAFSVKKFFKLVKYERLRLISYLLYGHQWPKIDVISPTELAKAGFFYMNDDTVKCAFCQGVVSDWQHGDVAMEVHQRLFPSCPFVLGESCGNTPFEFDLDTNHHHSSPASSNNSRAHFQSETAAAPSAPSDKKLYNKSNLPDYPRLARPMDRTQTFFSSNWKTTTASVQDFVEAGFFYTDCKDKVQCYHCGGVLYSWAPGEVPLEEHASFFPECHFLVSTRTQTYIEFVQFKNHMINLRQKLNTSPAAAEADIACMRAITYQNFLAMKQSADRVVNRLVRGNHWAHQETTIARTNRRTGADANSPGGSQSSDEEGGNRLEPSSSSSSSSSSSNHQNTFLQKFINKCSFFTHCQKVFQYLISLRIMPLLTKMTTIIKAVTFPTAPEAEERLPQIASSTRATVQQTTSNDSFNSLDSNSSGSADWSPTSSQIISVSLFGVDNGSLTYGFDENDGRQNSIDNGGDSQQCEQLPNTAFQCIICYSQQIEIVFVPCGHQLSCSKCSEKITICPVCRLKVDSKLRTYFANC